MPIYEYRCKNCNSVFEEWLKEFDVSTMPCPHCQGEGERMISMPSFILKGGGWYSTEYGGRGREGEASGAEPSGPESSGAASSAQNSDAPFAGVLEKKERAPKSAAPANTTAPAK